MRISVLSSDVCSSDLSADRPLAKSLSPVRSTDVHPAVINSPQWSVKGLFAIVSYTGPMPQTRDIIFAFHRVGGSVQVSAVAHLPSPEFRTVGPPSAGPVNHASLAPRTLEYVLTHRP